MALKATIHKADIQLNDVDRHYYASHTLTLARHPSETEERLMVRLLAFLCHADDDLQFGKGLSNEDEPALWNLDPTNAIIQWIDVGLPDAKRLRKACGRADAVLVYLYGAQADQWWRENQAAMRELSKVTVYHLPDTDFLKRICTRQMNLQCTISDGEIWLGDAQDTRIIERVNLSELAD